MVDPDVCTVVDLNAVPVFCFTRPIGRYTCVTDLKVAENDVASALDGEATTDDLSSIANSDDGFMARDWDFIAFRFCYQSTIHSDDETAILCRITLELVIRVGVHNFPSLTTYSASVQ